MYKLLVISLLGLGVIGATGQIVQTGQCDADVPLMQNFDLTQFLGTWHEIARADLAAGGDCSLIEFNSVGNTLTVLHKTVKENFYEEHQGQATVTNENARLVLDITSLSANPIDFWVLNTDYTTFALTYGCENVGTTQRRVYLWQLGRATSFPNLMIPANLNTLMVNLFNITNADLRDVSHSADSCYILPEIEAGQPVILPGQCDENLSGIPSFQAERFLGVWHQIQSYHSANALGSCNRARYSDGGDRVNVVNSEIIDQTLLTIDGYANVIGNNGSGKLNVALEVAPGVFVNSELLVLGTDYVQWALTYTCNNLANNTKQVFSWIVSRNRQLPAAAREAVDQVIASMIDLNSRYYQETDQSDDSCFHFPTSSVAGEPIVFGGQCNLSIPVQPNFSAVDYMGLWHDVERYPSQFQIGNCNNAFYTLGDGVVDVFNTEVIDETLSTINGLAVPVSDGKLVVTFPVAGTNLTVDTDYWVLSTDYSSYSLVYSCININEYEQQVSFWKLSRSKQLSTTANNAINSVINTLDILNQDYFLPTDQSVQGCFYYPEPQPGVPVVFPGTCEDNISVVPNFNTALFQGEWFEVEAYPKNPEEGQCVNHKFSTGTGSAALNLVSSSIEDQLLGSTNGQLTFYASETGGRFTLSFVSNGTTISFPYYVIATDYTNYALVYSCLDQIGTDFRGIWAWKLSRSKQLSTEGILQINNALANSPTVTLRNEYFEPIDQSDYACFYFPDLAPGEPVILPGQCETDLLVMQNFDASLYLGRWRLIESYPAGNQIGQCNQATYSLGVNGTILVYNNEVANLALREANGVATLIGNGSEAKLSVTFPNSPQPYELWILDTDYQTYSIVYGCENVGTQQRRVQSWKLSRATSLSDSAVAAINAITSSVTVLNDRYYQSISQSDDDCFYLPTPGGVGPMIFRGQCDPNIPVVANFDAVAYMGLWHDVESYPVPFQDGSCPNAFYTLNTELGQVDVFNTQVMPNQSLDTITGYANVVSDDGSAKLIVGFPTLGPYALTPYWVLATDYTSYALVYSCTNIDEERRSVTSWKLSRTKSMKQADASIINSVIDSIPVLNAQYYNVRDQSPEGCFYFPEPQPGVPVKFPGQCDQSITVVNNFNLSRFSGVWHEIEAYPKEEQTGECINHEFVVSSTGNSLNMLSYNVIAQSLGVTEGTVEFTSNDASARMVIRITSNGTAIEIPYWIIDTDYDNYALAYSCVNIDTDYRGVWSWKLSRTKQLRAVDSVAITNAIANVDVLGNQYYESISQSSEACFFYPDLAPGEMVVFPGQCGNITAMPNFDAAAYLGLWRTIESYPTVFQLGTCSDATYSLGDGVVVVYNTEVVDETLSTINGTAVAAADGTGKLYVTFPTSPIVSEYLVLDTDYETYSIVYSCVNSGTSDERIVFSWKLSRTNSLPAAAVAAIDAAVNSIDVLDERYYQVEKRTASDCFYFPEPNNSPVIFRGQCDENIAVQSNFDAARYMGTWYSIESYPAPFQGGTCATAEYTLVNGTVLVENTQVLDQVLDVQTGIAVVVDNAKLEVTFEVNGISITSSYWIIATDYDSYSLVYSCQNYNEEYKQVMSWKLSRSQTLTSASETSINNAMNNVQVLQQRYFDLEGHSETDCFFYPDNNGGDVVLSGLCMPDDQVPVVTNFSVTSFSGTWHEVARFPSDLQEGECAAASFSPGVQNSLNITQTTVENEGQTINVIPGAVSTDGRGVISATVAGVPFNALYILDTDYQEYALIYGCREFINETKQIYSWKLARSRAGLSPSANSVIDQAVYDNIDLFDGYYSYTEQTSDACFHYPEFEELPDTIELEGPCDETIRGVSNFNATAYLGLWREIERYPDANQFGTCDRAYYSSGDENVLVRNTQVLNNILLEQLGTATVASTDGTGQLVVNFNVNGIAVTANYYILATDYDNYALVYSCRNTLDEEGIPKRQIRSWKLSRTNTLSTEAQTAINQVISQTQGLAQQYYISTSQSDEDCFYVPEPTTNAPLFRGRCETTTGVANFDIGRFVGWWHELESYPVDATVGQCISSQYSVSGSSFQVVDTSVTNGEATIITGTVTASNGVLTRVLSNGETQQIVVLATDYDNYALLYSCADVTVDGEEYRRVWSAKHSKSRNLASVDVASINTLIESNSLLHNQLYQLVSQSDEACFYYPEVQDQRVILPGQCDLSIPVVANFDVEAYGGTWYQIQRYPQAYENPTSTCIGARYIINAGGWVDVLNWEVIDGTLETIAGTANVASDDRSAKLVVELPVVGTNLTVTTPLYVLDTDYDGYSLAYSCSNVNQFQRSIGVWKLSRERTLSTAGDAAINTVIQSRIELDARYFLTVQHNDECPEPSSSFIVKSSLLVVLICAVIQML